MALDNFDSVSVGLLVVSCGNNTWGGSIHIGWFFSAESGGSVSIGGGARRTEASRSFFSDDETFTCVLNIDTLLL